MVDTPSADAGHSLLGASGAARWLACPGSFALIQLHGKDEGSEDASLGTAAHKLAEICIRTGKDPWMFTGEVIDGFPVEADSPKAVDPVSLQTYVDFVRDLAERADMAEVEHTFGKQYRPNPHFWGTADFVAVLDGGDTLVVVDYKNGVGVEVAAEGSPQLQYYAWGALNELAFDFRPETQVRLVVVQPRSAHGPPIREWTTTAGDLTVWAHTVLLPGMQRAMAGVEETSPGPHCQFCPVKLECPSALGALSDVAGSSPDSPDDTLDALYVKAQTAKMVIRAIEARILARLQEGAKFENVKLVKKRAAGRIWKEGATDKLVEMLGDDAYRQEVLSPAQVEKISSKAKAFVQEYAFLPESEGYTLKPASDPAPAANPAEDIARQFAHYA